MLIELIINTLYLMDLLLYNYIYMHMYIVLHLLRCTSQCRDSLQTDQIVF